MLNKNVSLIKIKIFKYFSTISLTILYLYIEITFFDRSIYNIPPVLCTTLSNKYCFLQGICIQSRVLSRALSSLHYL